MFSNPNGNESHASNVSISQHLQTQDQRTNMENIVYGLNFDENLSENPYHGCSFDKWFAEFSYHKYRIYAFVWKFIVHREYAASKKLSITMNPGSIYKLLYIFQHFMDHSDSESFPLFISRMGSDYKTVQLELKQYISMRWECEQPWIDWAHTEITRNMWKIEYDRNVFLFISKCLLWIFLIFC